MISTGTIKDEARQIIERLPETATWDDLMEEIYLRQVIDHGLEDSDAGRTTPLEEVMASYGLPS